MKKITDFFASLKFVFMPNYWIMLGRYNPEWDEQLNELALKHDFIPVNSLSIDNTAAWASLGGIHMWVGSYPYFFFVKEEVIKIVDAFYENTKLYHYKKKNHDLQSRPSRLTIHRLRDKLVADFKKHNKTVDW